LARDTNGLLRKLMAEVFDGEYQAYKASLDGGFVREHFFGKYPELKAMVAHLSNEDIWRLNRGGHDPHKVYAAYWEATHHEGQPTVVLAKTVKGYGMGLAGEGQNITHQQKKLGVEILSQFPDPCHIPVSDDDIDRVPSCRPPPDSPEMKYLQERRAALGGYLPVRRRNREAPPLPVPGLEVWKSLLESSGERELSTTMVFVRALMTLTRDKALR